MYKVHKKLGETPYEALERLRASRPELKDLPLSYAGRLDPMAEGLLIILAGEECKQKDRYLGLPKQYEAGILLGISTDTGDTLGLVNKEKVMAPNAPAMASILGASFDISAVAAKLLGTRLQKYPLFSSRTVNGKPLVAYARDWVGQDKKVPAADAIPSQLITVKKFNYTGRTTTDLSEILGRIALVRGDFRQGQIKASWNAAIGEAANVADFAHLPVLHFDIVCSAGTYVRVLAEELGALLGVPACLFSLNRTRIGEYEDTQTVVL